MTYVEKLRDPRWQKKRLEVLSLAGWMCQKCGQTTKELHVHHLGYRRGLDPWDYPNDELRVLCERCHKDATIATDALNDAIIRWQNAGLSTDRLIDNIDNALVENPETPEDVLLKAVGLGVFVRRSSGKMLAVFPAEKLTDSLRSNILDRKKDVLRLLRSG